MLVRNASNDFAGGCLLRDVDEQRQVLDFLRRVSQKTGWRVHKLTERLHDDWAL